MHVVGGAALSYFVAPYEVFARKDAQSVASHLRSYGAADPAKYARPSKGQMWEYMEKSDFLEDQITST